MKLLLTYTLNLPNADVAVLKKYIKADSRYRIQQKDDVKYNNLMEYLEDFFHNAIDERADQLTEDLWNVKPITVDYSIDSFDINVLSETDE